MITVMHENPIVTHVIFELENAKKVVKVQRGVLQMATQYSPKQARTMSRRALRWACSKKARSSSTPPRHIKTGFAVLRQYDESIFRRAAQLMMTNEARSRFIRDLL